MTPRSLRRPGAVFLIVAVLLALSIAAGAQSPGDAHHVDRSSGVYRPTLATPEGMKPFLDRLEPGTDAFPLERQAKELDARFEEFARALKAGPAQVRAFSTTILDPSFRGGRLLFIVESEADGSALTVQRSVDLPGDPAFDARTFGSELQRLLQDMRSVRVAEFLITAIQADGPADPPTGLRTTVRFDIVGAGTKAHLVEHVGEWDLSWRRNASGWQIARWLASAHTVSRAKAPAFAEITHAALGGNESFRRQLDIDLDSWMATLDSVLTRDSNGHQGVSVGDADGDGLDDLYVAQPNGLPNRLYRARGDSTFEDITDKAGLGLLDDTAQSLFADVDNDGDQDLVIATAISPLLFVNDGKARFTQVPDAFRFANPLQGVLTSITMADYDRDGFLDLYLCVYSYFFGAGEDKAGTPAPYYDARNGPPGVLFRNDGRGRFVDATQEAGLDAGNNRYHFAAAWADYDGDGWTDLLVANDFGTKNLYRNLGPHEGKVMFEDVAAPAGVLDHGAGMSATFLDYDNDGLLDIYTGNMWSAPGRRVTAAPTFMPDATADVRDLYRRHVRGNSLLRNRGGGRFEDTTLDAGAEMGRWAWSSDALDFDRDGWEDLYVANGMLTRTAPTDDLEGFFWRQVVAHSPLTRVPGTPYDEAWRAINQLLIHGSIASRQRNVFLRNNGRGSFDEIGGVLGLDLDQDGRSFAVIDIDRDGDQDLVVMAARQAPQLRVFRNDFQTAARSLSVRLVGTKSNRDAIGARVQVKTEAVSRTKLVQAGSGFLSQHSKELIVGLGPSQRTATLTIDWPSGARQVLTDVPLNRRLQIVEGGDVTSQPFETSSVATTADPRPAPADPPVDTWLHEPFPAPDFSLEDTAGQRRSLKALRGKPAVILLWNPAVPAARTAFNALAAGASGLAKEGIGMIAVAIDARKEEAAAAASDRNAVPLVVGTNDVNLTYAILHRHLFMNRQPLRLPTCLLLDADGNIVKVYRGKVDTVQVVADAERIDASPSERLARALPFKGTFASGVAVRNYLPYGRELLDQGLESAAIMAFERAAQAKPGAPTLYRLGTLLARTGDAARAREAFERALSLQPDLAEANNDLGALLGKEGDVEGAITRFRAAIASTPDYPDALNNLGYALLLTGRDAEARALYERALALQPDFPEALNNLGLLAGRTGDMDRAEKYFREALRRRPDYGEAASNLAVVLVNRGEAESAVSLLDTFLERAPDYEGTYVTLAKIHLSAGRITEGVAVLERLLQRNPNHEIALTLVKQWKRH